MTIYGYARVSTDGQTLDAQVAALRAAAAEKVARAAMKSLPRHVRLSGITGHVAGCAAGPKFDPSATWGLIRSPRRHAAGSTAAR
jgi:hypothetical protein